MPLMGALIMGGISAAGAFGGGEIQAGAADRASKLQSDAAANALAFQRKVYGDSQYNFQPYLQTGKGAINQLAGLYGLPGGGGTSGQQNFGAFTNSPDYNFALNQGNLALQRQGAASGGLLSGGQLKAGEQFGQGLASQQFGNYFNRLLSLATMGQNSAANSASSAGTQANNIASTQLAQGNYQGAGVVGQANAYGSIFPNTLASYQMMNKNFGNNSAFAQNNPSQSNDDYNTFMNG